MGDIEDRRRAWTYNAAVEAGREPRSYAWENILEGTWEGRLDFKTWSNTTAAGHLICYFTALHSGERFRLSAFRPKGAAYRYTPKDGTLDFSQPGLDGRTFKLTVTTNSKGNSVWLSASLD